MSDIKFFGEVDIHPTKKVIMSEYPAWYFDQRLEQLEDEVGRGERQLTRGEIPQDRVPEFREALTKRKELYERILESVPKLDGVEKDRLAKLRKEIGKTIQSGYFTRSQMMKGTVDAVKEATRMESPIVEVKPEFAELLHDCNVRVVDGKVSRDGLVKAWKIMGKTINKNGGDEDTNAEVLRRD